MEICNYNYKNNLLSIKIMDGKDREDEVPDAINYRIPTDPSNPLDKLRPNFSIPPPRTPLRDHELRTHRSIYWDGTTGK